MLYFDKKIVANSKPHAAWWGEVQAARRFNAANELDMARKSGLSANAASVLPRDAWLDLDGVTRRVMRSDEGAAWMNDLMPLAKTVNIGKLVTLNRVSSDAGTVTRSLSGQVPIGMDKVTYDYRGSPVPIFQTAYGREWREWQTLQSENFDALSDDQEAHTAKLRRDMALYALDGDSSIVFQGYTAVGIRTSPYSKGINVGPAGFNIDLTSAATTATAIANFWSQSFGALMDSNYVRQKVNVYISPEIARNFDRPVSDGAGLVLGTIAEQILKGRRIAKFEVSFELTGNQFFAFVPSAEYIRPLIGMAANTTAVPRMMPTANYQFQIMAAMGMEIRADFNNRSGVFFSTNT
jgi:hypothetical protein